MRLYIAGPMTGIPQFNFPLFEAWMWKLAGAGFDVTSPHESDDHRVREAAWASQTGSTADLPPGFEGSDLLLTVVKNVTDIADCDGVALLPNWQKSGGVIHEIATAVRFGLPVAPAGLWWYTGNMHAEEALSYSTPGQDVTP